MYQYRTGYFLSSFYTFAKRRKLSRRFTSNDTTSTSSFNKEIYIFFVLAFAIKSELFGRVSKRDRRSYKIIFDIFVWQHRSWRRQPGPKLKFRWQPWRPFRVSLFPPKQSNPALIGPSGTLRNVYLNITLRISPIGASNRTVRHVKPTYVIKFRKDSRYLILYVCVCVIEIQVDYYRR